MLDHGGAGFVRADEIGIEDKRIAVLVEIHD